MLQNPSPPAPQTSKIKAHKRSQELESQQGLALPTVLAPVWG